METCGWGVLPIGTGYEGSSDPDDVARCPSDREARRDEVVVEALVGVPVLVAGIAMVLVGRRRDRQAQRDLPPDPFAGPAPGGEWLAGSGPELPAAPGAVRDRRTGRRGPSGPRVAPPTGFEPVSPP